MTIRAPQTDRVYLRGEVGRDVFVVLAKIHSAGFFEEKQFLDQESACPAWILQTQSSQFCIVKLSVRA